MALFNLPAAFPITFDHTAKTVIIGAGIGNMTTFTVKEIYDLTVSVLPRRRLLYSTDANTNLKGTIVINDNQSMTITLSDNANMTSTGNSDVLQILCEAESESMIVGVLAATAV